MDTEKTGFAGPACGQHAGGWQQIRIKQKMIYFPEGLDDLIRFASLVEIEYEKPSDKLRLFICRPGFLSYKGQCSDREASLPDGNILCQCGSYAWRRDDPGRNPQGPGKERSLPGKGICTREASVCRAFWNGRQCLLSTGLQISRRIPVTARWRRVFRLDGKRIQADQ